VPPQQIALPCLRCTIIQPWFAVCVGGRAALVELMP
jgi:hypothetical protein